ncbi:hypothetical protein V8C86DRAFT_2531855 [Haematococcus lacustris]
MPPRRRKGHTQGRVVTYDLSGDVNLRNAFESDEDFDEELVQLKSGPAQGRKRLDERNQRSRDSGCYGQLPERRLHDGPDVPEQLMEMFPLLEPSVVEDVFRSCRCSFEDTLQSLMALVASAEAASAAAGSSGLAVNGSPSQGQGSTQIGLTPLQPPASDPPVHLWDLLHESVRERILSHLSARELAAAAATCQDFASRVRCMRLSARALTLPTGASLAAVLGMVAGHSNARAISLVRWGARALKETAFAALMTAIAQGSHSRRRSVRVEALSLRGWTKCWSKAC